MRLILLLFLSFTLIPVLELILLFKVADLTSGMLTFMIVIFTGLLGAALAKMEGIASWQRIRAALRQGQLPGNELVQGVLILIAGVLLVTPGFMTDIVGFTLLIPFTRRYLSHRLLQHFKNRLHLSTSSFASSFQAGGMPPRPERRTTVEDIEAERIDDDDERP